MLADLQLLVGAIIQPLRHFRLGHDTALPWRSGDCGCWACRSRWLSVVVACESKKQTRGHRPRTNAARSASILHVLYICES